MSVTFFVENAPTKTVPNEFFDIDEPEHYIYNPKMIDISAWPELNVCQANVNSLLKLAQLPIGEDSTGTIHYKDLHVVMRNLIAALASERKRSMMVHDSFEEKNFFHSGTTDDRVCRYLETLMEVVSYCIEHSQNLVWG